MKSIFQTKKTTDPYSYAIGPTGGAPKNDPYAYSISTKSDPYAYNVPDKTKSNFGKQSKDSQQTKQKGPPKDFIPERFALSYNPPTILLEYKDPSTKKLYHHLMKLKKLTKQTKTSDAIDYIKKKHFAYFQVMDQQQLEKLIQKLKSKLGNKSLQPVMQNEEQEEQQDYDFDYDYQDEDG